MFTPTYSLSSSSTATTTTTTAPRWTPPLTTSPSYITHQRRSALIPSDIQLSPEDEQSVRMRTGYVNPSAKGVVVVGAEYTELRRSEERKTGSEADQRLGRGESSMVGETEKSGKAKRKRMASVAGDDGEGHDDEGNGDGDGDYDMIERVSGAM